MRKIEKLTEKQRECMAHFIERMMERHGELITEADYMNLLERVFYDDYELIYECLPTNNKLDISFIVKMHFRKKYYLFAILRGLLLTTLTKNQVEKTLKKNNGRGWDHSYTKKSKKRRDRDKEAKKQIKLLTGKRDVALGKSDTKSIRQEKIDKMDNDYMLNNYTDLMELDDDNNE